MKKTIFPVLVCLFAGLLNAQNNGGQSVNQVQPTIMVIPFAKEGENLRTVLEADVSRRVAVTKVKEAFDSRGFTTVDFLAKLKAAETDGIFTGDNQSDIKTALIDYSGADIYVETEVAALNSSSGNSARLIITAYDAFTGNSLANKTGSSPKFYTDDFGKLVEKALEERSGANQPQMLEDFLNVMQTKFSDIVANGRFIKVIFSLAQDAEVDFDSELTGGATLSEALETWMGENAFKNYYHIQGSSSMKVTFDEVRIPLRDEKGKNYTPTRFSQLISKYCNSLSTSENPAAKLKVKREARGGTIYITFQ